MRLKFILGSLAAVSLCILPSRVFAQADNGGASAEIPWYWVADTQLYLGNSMNAADVMRGEMGMKVQSPRVLGRQAEYMDLWAARALDDLMALERNALATDPRVVPVLRDAAAQLTAAQGDITRLRQAASHGLLGPTYAVTVTSALTHLRTAEGLLPRAEAAYGSGEEGNAAVGARRERVGNDGYLSGVNVSSVPGRIPAGRVPGDIPANCSPLKASCPRHHA